MGLVDYGSDSDSDSEPVQQPVAPTPVPAVAPPTTKKPFQKLIDRSGSGSGKIIVNLGSAGTDPESKPAEDEPPAKRAKTAAGGSSRFSSFGSFLPAPKKTAPIANTASTSAPAGDNSNKPKPIVNLRTGAEPAFSRTGNDNGDGGFGGSESTSGSGFSSGLNLPAPKKTPAGPSIPEGQKPEEEVKLVGKPLMFKPLSVARKPQKKKAVTPKTPAAQSVGDKAATTTAPALSAQDTVVAAQQAAPKRKQVSLFSMEEEEATPTTTVTTSATGAYEPLFTAPEPSTNYEHNESDVTGDYDSYTAPTSSTYNSAPSNASHQQSLGSIADDLALNKTARRELFGRQRGGKNRDAFEIPEGAKIVNFNMEQEYEHNNALRASGEQVYNPVRAIAPGKHSLRQMVNMAQSNQSALEDSWAQGRNNRKDAAGKYGWK
ncbi:mitotic checkpoint regulator, MAD2B-interacting-domain-containing protein [Neurospora tetraspora]|uniref:Mitotic checkpoint regulator, MAD2B-interacting-domain-containing protein n=1 Tax=Neurospora tetraspora TaxID=94610 RepID=A0AAE0JB20_9PEZI|nr:mitotic checkpoint regulator, MAD2B-interacting-domain-containing protein [Neurospora tetraspora]